MRWQQMCGFKGLLSNELKEHIRFSNPFIHTVEKWSNILQICERED